MLDQAQIDGFKDGSKESMSGEIVPVQKENQMTIDTKKLRRLAQAATRGPWVSKGRYIGTPSHMSYIGEVRDQCGNWSDTEKSTGDAAFIAAANPAAISELLDRLEAAEKAVTEAYQRGYATGQEEIEKARDALRALVVMRFDHDYPPQFTQGHDLHELTEPVTAEHCRWFVAEIERLRTDCDALREKIACMERQEPVAFALYSGWARKAVYLSEIEACEQRDRRQLTANLGGSLEAYRVAPLYLAPGAKGE